MATVPVLPVEPGRLLPFATVTVTVLPTRTILVMVRFTPPIVAVEELLTVAGVVGLIGTEKVKLVVLGTETTLNVPLNSV